MSSTNGETEKRTQPKAYTFSLKMPYLSRGRITKLVAETEDLWVHTKVNAEGGENALHTHTKEDHAFIVLEGEVTFYDADGSETKLQAHQGIMIPKGAYYRYLNTGTGNLMIVRVGAGERPEKGETRLAPDGRALDSGSAENKHIEAVPIPGKYFGA